MASPSSISRAQARQLVRHGHIEVDGRRVDIPSFRLNAGNVVSVKEASRKIKHVGESMEFAQGRGIPSWLELDGANSAGTVVEVPTRDEIRVPIQEQLIVELYSR